MSSTYGARNKSFVVGDCVKIYFTVMVDDVLTNPGAVVITVEEPDGNDNDVSDTNVSTGIFYGTFTSTQSGYHRVRITGTSPAEFARELTFYVVSSGIAVDGP